MTSVENKRQMLVDQIKGQPFVVNRFLFDETSYSHVLGLFEGTTVGEIIEHYAMWAKPAYERMYVELDRGMGQVIGCLIEGERWNLMLQGADGGRVALPAHWNFGSKTLTGSPKVQGDSKVQEAISSVLGNVVCAMLALNQPSTHQLTKVDASAGIRRGKRVVYRAHHTVTIRLGLKPKHLISLLTDHRGSPRRHGVRGHWVNFRKTQGCEHDFAELEPFDGTRFECRCGQRRSWKPHFERGDAGRGYVTKDYLVTHGDRS